VVPHDPPSKVILEEFNRTHEVPQESKLLKVAEKVLLPRDETEMWFQHLKKVHKNRQKGIAKAAETRKAKRMQQKQSNEEKGEQ
jgi:predicted solute-binding protein